MKIPNAKTAIKFGATGLVSVLGAKVAENVLASVKKEPGSILRLAAQILGGGAGAFLASKFVG